MYVELSPQSIYQILLKFVMACLKSALNLHLNYFRLRPVELVEEPESDIYEILKMDEETERQKDEYFEERERQEQLNRIEPVEPDPDYEFEELNNHANELLLNRKRMKKQEFIKKLDIYMIIMRKKLINESEKCKELNKIITSFNSNYGNAGKYRLM